MFREKRHVTRVRNGRWNLGGLPYKNFIAYQHFTQPSVDFRPRKANFWRIFPRWGLTLQPPRQFSFTDVILDLNFALVHKGWVCLQKGERIFKYWTVAVKFTRGNEMESFQKGQGSSYVKCLARYLGMEDSSIYWWTNVSIVKTQILK